MSDNSINTKKDLILNYRRIEVLMYIMNHMKNVKICEYNALMNKIKENVKLFMPSSKMIKIGIEKLIQDGYLQRSTENINILQYVP